jgi:hypothetical protein
MMALGVIGAVGSAAAGMMGAMASANAATAAATQNAQIAEYNREVAERNRLAALAQGDAEANDQRRDNTRVLSHIRAQYGASGLSVAGSPLDVITDTALEQELDVKKGLYKAELKGIGYRDEANNYAMKRDLSLMEAESAQKALPYTMAGQFFGGMTGVGKSLMAVN